MRKLYKDVFEDINAFNDFIENESIKRGKKITPISVTDFNFSNILEIYYTSEDEA